MYGSDTYAAVPYAALVVTAVLVVAACIHTELQILYPCTVSTVLLNSCVVSTMVCPCTTANGVC